MQDESRSRSSKSRRAFIASSGALVLGTSIRPLAQPASDSNERLALLGGPKAVPKLSRAQSRWGEPERKQLDSILSQDSLFYWKGPQTRLFTERFRQVCPLEHVMPCSSGTAALHIAVSAAGIGPGDEVITTPITDMGTVIGVLYQQGVPVFADLQPSTYNLDPAEVERRITPRTKAIIAVHLCGNPCDMGRLRALADAHRLVLIEDCAQAWGARYRGKPVGLAGHIACFSLQQSKHITCGDGGVVASSDPRFGPKLQLFGDKGYDRIQGGLFQHFATNYRITEAQSALAAAQMERLESIVETRSKLGRLLTKLMGGLNGVTPHEVHPENRCSYWFYFFRLDPKLFRASREEMAKAMAAEGAPISAGYIPVPLHRNPIFQRHGFFAGRWPIRELGLTAMDYSRVETPEAERILASGIRVGLQEFMSEEDIRAIAKAIRKVARHFQAA